MSVTGQVGAVEQRQLTPPRTAPTNRDGPRVPPPGWSAPAEAATSASAGSPSATSGVSGTLGVGTTALTRSTRKSLADCSSSARSKAPGKPTNGSCHENTAVTRPSSCASASASAQRSAASPYAEPSTPTTMVYVIRFTARRPRDGGAAGALHLLEDVSWTAAGGRVLSCQLAKPGWALTFAGIGSYAISSSCSRVFPLGSGRGGMGRTQPGGGA